MAMMEHEDISNENLAGHLLVAAPYLDGAGFHHSVIFLSRAEKEFVIGHILNHPSGMTSRMPFASMPLSSSAIS